MITHFPTSDLLIVDDDDDFLMNITEMLAFEFPTLRIQRLPGITGAIERIRSLRPKVMLLDHQMADGTGFELLDAVHDALRPEERPVVIYLTCHLGTRNEALQCGAADYFFKDPRKWPQLCERIRRCLSGYSLPFGAGTVTERFLAQTGARISTEVLQETAYLDELSRLDPVPLESFYVRIQRDGRIERYDIERKAGSEQSRLPDLSVVNGMQSGPCAIMLSDPDRIHPFVPLFREARPPASILLTPLLAEMGGAGIWILCGRTMPLSEQLLSRLEMFLHKMGTSYAMYADVRRFQASPFHCAFAFLDRERVLMERMLSFLKADLRGDSIATFRKGLETLQLLDAIVLDLHSSQPEEPAPVLSFVDRLTEMLADLDSFGGATVIVEIHPDVRPIGNDILGAFVLDVVVRITFEIGLRGVGGCGVRIRLTGKWSEEIGDLQIRFSALRDDGGWRQDWDNIIRRSSAGSLAGFSRILPELEVDVCREADAVCLTIQPLDGELL
ncbi:response regulator (plasmid) [Azospirillum argentinense]|uniref:Response regulator n=1 Tax=Azospirillum argentinense TaxID=2970906 RepID=A0A4D8PLX0_9PROT|nr:response regulator [Azospirillum argentinense]QCN96708.1 response regulator [Azospirillum argentinense]